MPYPELGMLIIASSEFQAYQHRWQIPEHDVERSDPQNPSIIIYVGSPMTVISVVPPVILLWPSREPPGRWVWALESDVQRNTVPEIAVDDLDIAFLMEYRIRFRKDPSTIWAARTACVQMDEGFDQ